MASVKNYKMLFYSFQEKRNMLNKKENMGVLRCCMQEKI